MDRGLLDPQMLQAFTYMCFLHFDFGQIPFLITEMLLNQDKRNRMIFSHEEQTINESFSGDFSKKHGRN